MLQHVELITRNKNIMDAEYKCPINHTETFEVVLKKGRIISHNCSYFNKVTKACMASKKIPPPICPLYGKVWSDEFKKNKNSFS